MIWAIVDNDKVEATPKKEGICPFCKGKVYSKCGDVNAWHWAHFKNENCDSWYEPESFWHKHWKMTFGKENAEIVRKKNDKWHVADIYTKEGVVIELQNSPIQKSVIKEREEFYGRRMLWIINGEHFKKNLIVKDYWEEILDYPSRYPRIIPEIQKGNNGEFFKWLYPHKGWKEVQRPIFIDFGEGFLFRVEEGMGTKQIRGTYFPKEKFIKKYGGDYDFYSRQ